VDALEEILHSTGTIDKSTSFQANLRGAAEALFTEDAIQVIVPRSTYLLEPDVQMQWNKIPSVSSYTVELRTFANAVAYSTTVSDSVVTINLSQGGLTRGTNYYWRVLRADKHSVCSDEYSLQWLPESKAQMITDTLRMIDDEVGVSSPFASVVKAQFAEDNGLHASAIGWYQTAIRSSDSEDYKRYFRNYLRRLNVVND
jgi:hypothetical protein